LVRAWKRCAQRPAARAAARRRAPRLTSPRAAQVKLEHRSFETPSRKSIEVTTVASNYHIEVNPGDAGIYDRLVVGELVKEMAAYAPLTAGGEAGRSFKVVILSEVDRLTKDAQAALRRTMEKYSSSCRLILVRRARRCRRRRVRLTPRARARRWRRRRPR
jgi:DNA polymerase III delta prime subunit